MPDSDMPRLSVTKLECAIFSDSKVSRKICVDYNILGDESPAIIARKILNTFRRFRNSCVEKEIHCPNILMKAAFWAIISRQTDWLRLWRYEDKIADVTANYSPAKVNAKVIRNSGIGLSCTQTSMDGALHRNLDRAEKCANIIEACPALGASLKDLHHNLRSRLSDHDASLAVAILLGNEARTACRQWSPPQPLETWKLPGMGPTIASEFLRNLGFEAIKPDTHIRRLLGVWHSGFPSQATDRWHKISACVKSKSTENAEFAQFALFGHLISLPHFSLTEFDNLLWLYARYYKGTGYLA